MTDQTQTAERQAVTPAPAQPQHKPPAIIAGGQVAAIVPQNIEEAFRVADAFYKSGLAPSSLKSAPAVLVAVMAGAELGFAPFQSMQSFAVINGKAAMWGDAIPALLWSNGFKIEEWVEGDGDGRKAFCKVTRPDGQIIVRTFSVEDAKEAGLWGKQGPWQQYRARMLAMRARAFAARDGAADALRGLPIYEEVRDYQDNGPRGDGGGQGPGLGARLGGPKTGEGFTVAQAQHVEETHPADNADVIDAVVEEIREEANAEPEVDLSHPCEACGAPAGEACAEDCPGVDVDGEEPTGATQGADDWVDPDDAQEWTDKTFARAEIKKGGEVVRPASGTVTQDFPGDREPEPEPPTEQAKPAAPASLKARVAACRTRLSDIGKPNVTKLNATWKNAKELRDDLDAADPDAFTELVAFYEELLAQHEDAAKEAVKK